MEVSIQAVSPLLGLAFELAGAAATGAAAVVAGEGVGAEPEAAAVTLPAATVWACAALVSIASVERMAIKAKTAKPLIRSERPIRHSPTQSRPAVARLMGRGLRDRQLRRGGHHAS